MAEHLYGLEMDPKRLFTTAKSHWSWTWIIVLGGLLWVTTLWFWTTPLRQHLSQSKQQKLKYTAKDLQKKLQTAQNSGAILDHLSRFICHHARCQDPHEANFSNAELQRKCVEFISRLEASQYAPGASNDEQDKSQAFELAKDIERLQQKGGQS